MSQTNKEYVNTLVERLKGLKNTSESQSLIIRYHGKESLTKEEQSLFSKLVMAEKKADQYNKAKAEVRKALNVEKEKERKSLTQDKIISGSMLITGATTGKNMAYYQGVMRKILDDGLCGDRDKVKYQQILDRLPKPIQSNELSGRELREQRQRDRESRNS